MTPLLTGSIDTKLLADGARAFHLRRRVDGRRQREILHERARCECGCGWNGRTVRTELGNIRTTRRAGPDVDLLPRKDHRLLSRLGVLRRRGN